MHACAGIVVTPNFTASAGTQLLSTDGTDLKAQICSFYQNKHPASAFCCQCACSLDVLFEKNGGHDKASGTSFGIATALIRMGNSGEMAAQRCSLRRKGDDLCAQLLREAALLLNFQSEARPAKRLPRSQASAGQFRSLWLIFLTCSCRSNARSCQLLCDSLRGPCVLVFRTHEGC